MESLYNKEKLSDLLCENCKIDHKNGFSFFECRDGNNKVVFMSSVMGNFDYVTRVIVEYSEKKMKKCKNSIFFQNGVYVGMPKNDMLALPISFSVSSNKIYRYDEEKNVVYKINEKKTSFTRSEILEIVLKNNIIWKIDYSVIDSDPELLER